MANIIVTSVSQKYWNMSGQTWLSSLLRYNPDVKPYIVSEDININTGFIYLIKDYLTYARFCDLAAEKMKDKDPTNYRWQAIRFCHKVFALYQAREQFPDDTIYWFDADVEFTGPIDFNAIKPDPYGITILGRKGWHHVEGGFIGFHPENPVIDYWYNMYTTGNLFMLNEWHDCYALQFILNNKWYPVRDLSAHLNTKHVWPDTVLANFSMHHKGPGRKVDAFGTNEAIGNTVLQVQDDIDENVL